MVRSIEIAHRCAATRAPPSAAPFAAAARLARRLALIGLCLTLPALADDLTPAPQSADPVIAAALRYEHGDGVAANAGRAAEMYCAAAREGNADAAFRLGWMYANGVGVEQDDRHAAALFMRAASLGHAAAAQKLATLSTGNARQPRCMILAPPPAVATQPDAEGEPPAQVAPETSATAAAAPLAVAGAGAMAPPASPPVGDQITLAIARWGDAWSRRQIERYLAAYAPDFQPPAGESRQQWERRRRARIVDKAWIDITLHDLAIVVDGDLASARFVLDYRSDKGHDSTVKTLTLVKSGRTWLIRREQSEALPSPVRAR
jgi:TPR repeat protein